MGFLRVSADLWVSQAGPAHFYRLARIWALFYASARGYARLYAIERDLARFYASGSLGVVFFLIGISDLAVIRLASFSSKDLRAVGRGFTCLYASVRVCTRLYATFRDYTRLSAI